MTSVCSWGNNGTKGSGVQYAANGGHNQSVLFRGIAADNITIPSSPTLNLKQGYTISFWINYTAGTDQFGFILSRREVDTNPQTYYFITFQDGNGANSRFIATFNL